MTKEQFIALYEKCASGHCTAEELRQLENYHDDFELTVRQWTAEMGNPDEVKQQILEKLKSQILHEGKNPSRKFQYWAAASILILLLAGGVFWRSVTNQQKTPHQITKVEKAQTIISPGQNRAILTLANGEKLNLDDSPSGVISTQGNSTVTKIADGILAYGSNNGVASESAVSYNTIETPRGGQYQLALSDGTMVWLNASSSLKYPATFSGKERNVELTGEAYFEVAKNKDKPFNVKVNGMKVEVLGTHFNVMAYNDENSIETTLLEGSVKLTKKGASATLLPNQQGSLSRDAQGFRVTEVVAQDIIAWKNGFFKFDNENIETIMRKVARWYDVDITYEGDLTRQNFGGTVSRFNDLSKLLKTLELTGTIHFKIDGRRITVMP
jgi:ferric-dicitrate binding protein FerR (iron transport regulator)